MISLETTSVEATLCRDNLPVARAVPHSACCYRYAFGAETGNGVFFYRHAGGASLPVLAPKRSAQR